MKKIFLLFCFIFLNCCAMQKKLATQMHGIINSIDDDSEEIIISNIERLLEKECDLNFNMRAGFTALHYAVINNKYRVCELLVKNGANPHIENCDDKTPFNLAHGEGNLLHDRCEKDERLVEILKLSKCKVYRPGMNRMHALHALEEYNTRYKLELELGTTFE